MTEPTANSTIEPTKEEGSDMGVLTKKRKWAPEPQKIRSGRDAIKRHFGLDVEMGRLEQDEQTEVLALLEEARAGDNGINLTQLPKGKLKKLQSLIGRAADDPDYFAREREKAEVGAKVRELARKARRAPDRPIIPREQGGGVWLPAALLETYFRAGGQIADLGTLVYTLHCFEDPGGAGSRIPKARWEGDTLLLDRSWGPWPAKLDVRGRMSWEKSLKLWAAAGMFTIEFGNPTRISLNAMSRAILERDPAQLLQAAEAAA